MDVNRRVVLKGMAALFAVVGLPTWASVELLAHDRPAPLAQHLFFPTNPSPNPSVATEAVHLLNRIAYGPTAAELGRVQKLGINAYLEEQLQPAQLDDSAVEQELATLPTLQMHNAELLGQDPQQVMLELEQAAVFRALYSRRQLQEVLVDFWSNHFNIFSGKGQCRFFKTTDDRETIRPHVLGRFRDLLGASAKSPAMLFFLDNQLNHREAPNENYGRELMELHTLGVDGGYTEADVQAVARCFTGWTIRQGDFFFAPRQHDTTQKQMLGVTIPAGRGMEDGEQVLDLLAKHPSTAHFIATKLCRRFVADTPPDSLVQRTAQVFQTTDGDLRQVMRSILTSPEFSAAKNQKFRRPAEFVIAAARALGAETDGKPLVLQIRQLGQRFFGEPAPNGYPDVTAPWLNTSTMLGRWNFALQLTSGRLPKVQVDLSDLTNGANLTEVANKLVTALLPGHETETLTSALVDLLGHAPGKAVLGKQQVGVVAGLLVAAPLFQWH